MRVSLREEAIDERIAFTMASGGNGQLIMDQREFSISERHGVVFSAGPLRILNYQEDCETSVLVMNGRKISECCAKLLGRELDTDVRFDTGFDLSTGNGQSWVRLFQYATAELSNPHSLFRHLPAARQQLEQTVLTGFLLGHAHTYSDALLRPQAAAAPHYVKRAEAYIESHFAEPLSLAEIAAQSGVSARSLQNGFQNFRNMTPMAFLRSIRLQRAHRALLAADPAIARVTDIALACGFNHMGEFASAYRHAFGGTPRQTLGRARAA
jgi:AraC-like DNA-binding protein